MSTHVKWNAGLIVSGICAILVAGFLAAGAAQEKKEIPDHSGFSSCQACHSEKHSMWEASNHGKAVRAIAKADLAAGDCRGCHSTARPASGGSRTAAGAAGEESHHQVSCLACHARQDTKFAHRVVVDPEELCDTCHFQRSVFWGTGAHGIEDSRNFHSGVPCVSCHMTEGNHRMQVLRPDDPGLTGKRLDTCTACHKDNNREARVHQIQEWQGTYAESMAPLVEDVKAVEAALKKNPGLLDEALKKKFDDVKFNLALLERDGSRGFHNFVFSLEITGLASDALKEIKAAIK